MRSRTCEWSAKKCEADQKGNQGCGRSGFQGGQEGVRAKRAQRELVPGRSERKESWFLGSLERRRPHVAEGAGGGASEASTKRVWFLGSTARRRGGWRGRGRSERKESWFLGEASAKRAGSWARSHKESLVHGLDRTSQKGLEGGDPLEPLPLPARFTRTRSHGRTRARSHTRSVADALGRTHARMHMSHMRSLAPPPPPS
jgi:hypothetical protein